MRVKEINVYTYSELSEKAKENAKNKYGRFDDVHFLTEEMEEQLYEAGFTDTKVSWTLSCCQGDGVSFTGEWYGRDSGMDAIVQGAYEGEVPKNVKRILPFVRLQLTRISSFYCHENTVRSEVEIVENYTGNIDRVEAEVQELERILEIYRLEICKKLERFGYDYIKDYESEERFAEDADANEWEFYENGEIAK